MPDSNVLPRPVETSSEPPAPRTLRARIGAAYLRMGRWTIDGGAPDVDKAVIVAAPHTSNWDLPVTLATAWVLGIELQWFGKDSLFKPPFGWMLKLLGGVAVDRSRRTNAVQARIDEMARHERIFVLVPPEGTRSRVEYWKTGFYWIAVGADVPIILGFVDWKTKRAGLGHVFRPTGDPRADEETIRAFYDGMEGKFPELTSPVRFRDPG